MLSTQSDERLVDLVRAGSDPAFEAIVERYRRALMRYVSRILPPERAEDVVQQSFVKAYEAMLRGSAELNLRPWLYRIAHNTALNALRDRALVHAELDERIDGVERPDQAFERSTSLRELVSAVQALPERQRDAILLRELEGRTYEEIAASLGVTDGAVRQLLNRARNTLRAAAAAITPMPLATRLASADTTEPVAARVAELVGAGSGAMVMKLCATALVTGAVVGGAAVVPDVARDDSGGAPVGAGTAQAADDSDDDGSSGSASDGGTSGGAGGATGGAGDDGRGERGEGHGGRRGGDDEDDDRSGPGDDDDRSGPGDDDDDRSGPGDRDDDSDDTSGHGDGNSGPGGDDEDDSRTSGHGGGSGTGSGEDGGGSGGSGSGGSGHSGSGKSGSGGGEAEGGDDLLEPPEIEEAAEDNSGGGKLDLDDP
ncbi:MAG TPA: sigma-70 family RNA polymerase sigma factor, partial [Thermoleophilaceae bacterium]